jgi:APA family basic amino acid/polyamine antiporter
VKAPHQKRLFKTPLPWLVGLVGIGGCVYLFTSLPLITMELCLGWNVLGLLVYWMYAQHQSLLGRSYE